MGDKRAHPYIFFGCWIAWIAASVALIAFFLADLQLVLSCWIGINVGSFVLMGLDKSLAARRSLRAPEKIFFAVALLGGGLGILAGMQLFRHKTKKLSFQCVLLLISMAQIFIASKLGLELR